MSLAGAGVGGRGLVGAACDLVTGVTSSGRTRGRTVCSTTTTTATTDGPAYLGPIRPRLKIGSVAYFGFGHWLLKSSCLPPPRNQFYGYGCALGFMCSLFLPEKFIRHDESAACSPPNFFGSLVIRVLKDLLSCNALASCRPLERSLECMSRFSRF